MRDADMRREREMPRDTDMSRDDDMRTTILPKRQGDILGLGGSEVPKSPDDPSVTTEVDTTAHNRMRSMDLDEPAGTRDCRGARVRPASIWAAAEAAPISSSALP